MIGSSCFSDVGFYAENKPTWRFSGGRAAANRWRRRPVEATKRLRFYIMYTAVAAENRFAAPATGGAEKSGRAAARRSLLRLLLLLLLLTKRAPAGDVLGARHQLFVVDARALFNRGTREIRPRLWPVAANATDDIVVVIA